MFLAGAADGRDGQHAAVDGDVAARGDRLVDVFRAPQGLVGTARAQVEPGQVEGGAEHQPSLVGGERAADAQVRLDLPVAQVACQVVHPAVAGEQRGHVQRVRRGAEQAAVPVEDLGDAGCPGGQRRARHAGPAGQRQPPERCVDGAGARHQPAGIQASRAALARMPWVFADKPSLFQWKITLWARTARRPRVRVPVPAAWARRCPPV